VPDTQSPVSLPSSVVVPSVDVVVSAAAVDEDSEPTPVIDAVGEDVLGSPDVVPVSSFADDPSPPHARLASTTIDRDLVALPCFMFHPRSITIPTQRA